jgi:hypothetical protein
MSSAPLSLLLSAELNHLIVRHRVQNAFTKHVIQNGHVVQNAKYVIQNAILGHVVQNPNQTIRYKSISSDSLHADDDGFLGTFWSVQGTH